MALPPLDEGSPTRECELGRSESPGQNRARSRRSPSTTCHFCDAANGVTLQPAVPRSKLAVTYVVSKVRSQDASPLSVTRHRPFFKPAPVSVKTQLSAPGSVL